MHSELILCSACRPLLTQFCANDPETLVAAAEMVQDHCDAVDLNLGCPQRIAKRGRYGAFLMDDLPLVASLISALASRLRVPVTAKVSKGRDRLLPHQNKIRSKTQAPVMMQIRIFDDLSKTVEYARMVEASGAALIAVHGRTREQKTASAVRADWRAIKVLAWLCTVSWHLPVGGR